jgi:outer membrane protein OmpA-like peptidoglycan-associated protein
MRKTMRTLHRTTLLSLLCAGAAVTVGCGRTLPPKELNDARTTYNLAAQGPAAQETPAQLHAARTSLDNAERHFADEGDEPEVRDKAYIALRKAQIADTAARVALAMKAKQAADAEVVRLQAQSLQFAQSALANSQQHLAKTQEQLDKERIAREEAEKKAAQALADLQRIAAVKQETRGMVITLNGGVLFKTDEATLLPTATTKLNEVADALLRGNPDANITIEGHTDSTGTRDHNMVLAQQRADSVKGALVAHGVAPDRIRSVGVGPDRPVADNKSPEGRANNRRVEIIVDNRQPGGSMGTTAGTGTGTGSGAPAHSVPTPSSGPTRP